MKNLKYLNGVLTVIAVCLVLLTLSAVGIIPKAVASNPTKFVSVPVNADGSINVRLNTDDPMPVNLTQISGGGLPTHKRGNQFGIPYVPVEVWNPSDEKK